MKNLLLSALLCVVAGFAAVADDFKILYLTTPDITVGGKTLRVGDTFAGTAPISWTAPRQAMKVLNTATKKQSLVVAEKYRECKSRDMASYLVASKQLSTRRGELINTLELGVALGETHYLLDSIRVETKLPVDDNRFFFATYDYNGETINKKLVGDGNALVFDRSLYTIDGKAIEPFDVTLSVWYLDRTAGTKTLVTDKMVVLPL